MVVIQSFTRPTTGIKHEERNVKAIINTRDVGKGTLYITESVLSWVDDNSEQGFSLQYLHIAVHAISRDLSSFPEECMYLMLNADIEQDEGSNDANKSNASETCSTEIRFIPDNRSALETMYSAMIECQELHPDPEDSSDSDSEVEILEKDVVPEVFQDAHEGPYEGPPLRPVPILNMLPGCEPQMQEVMEMLTARKAPCVAPLQRGPQFDFKDQPEETLQSEKMESAKNAVQDEISPLPQSSGPTNKAQATKKKKKRITCSDNITLCHTSSLEEITAVLHKRKRGKVYLDYHSKRTEHEDTVPRVKKQVGTTRSNHSAAKTVLQGCEEENQIDLKHRKSLSYADVIPQSPVDEGGKRDDKPEKKKKIPQKRLYQRQEDEIFFLSSQESPISDVHVRAALQPSKVITDIVFNNGSGHKIRSGLAQGAETCAARKMMKTLRGKDNQKVNGAEANQSERGNCKKKIFLEEVEAKNENPEEGENKLSCDPEKKKRNCTKPRSKLSSVSSSVKKDARKKRKVDLNDPFEVLRATAPPQFLKTPDTLWSNGYTREEKTDTLGKNPKKVKIANLSIWSDFESSSSDSDEQKNTKAVVKEKEIMSQVDLNDPFEVLRATAPPQFLKTPDTLWSNGYTREEKTDTLGKNPKKVKIANLSIWSDFESSSSDSDEQKNTKAVVKEKEIMSQQSPLKEPCVFSLVDDDLPSSDEMRVGLDSSATSFQVEGASLAEEEKGNVETWKQGKHSLKENVGINSTQQRKRTHVLNDTNRGREDSEIPSNERSEHNLIKEANESTLFSSKKTEQSKAESRPKVQCGAPLSKKKKVSFCDKIDVSFCDKIDYKSDEEYRSENEEQEVKMSHPEKSGHCKGRSSSDDSENSKTVYEGRKAAGSGRGSLPDAPNDARDLSISYDSCQQTFNLLKHSDASSTMKQRTEKSNQEPSTYTHFGSPGVVMKKSETQIDGRNSRQFITSCGSAHRPDMDIALSETGSAPSDFTETDSANAFCGRNNLDPSNEQEKQGSVMSKSAMGQDQPVTASSSDEDEELILQDDRLDSVLLTLKTKHNQELQDFYTKLRTKSNDVVTESQRSYVQMIRNRMTEDDSEEATEEILQQLTIYYRALRRIREFLQEIEDTVPRTAQQ